MPDDPNQRGKADRARINLHERHEVEYWTEHLQVSEAELRAAVKAVGNSVRNVREHLGRGLEKV